jgi:hypothetical protein
MADVGAALRAIKMVHGGPYVCDRCAAGELAGNDGLHGAKEETEDSLVHDPPAVLLWIGDVHGGIVGALLDDLV